MQPVRVLIADDHRLFREGLRQICEQLGGFEVLGEAENGQMAVEMAQQLAPDVILMDINMPVLDGVQATSLVAEMAPAVRVIILTMYRQERYVFQAVKAGARGYLLKDTDGRALIEAVRRVQQGEALIDPGLAVHLLKEFRDLDTFPGRTPEMEQLTKGEMDVLCRVAAGADNKVIAAELDLAESTVANRLRDVFQKLHVNNRTQAALVALRRGWARLDIEEP